MRKNNYSLILIGLLAIIASALAFKFTYDSRNIRINGKVLDCPIQNITYSVRGGNHVDILFSGMAYPAGRLIEDKQVGDTITVRYIEGENRVVQESFESWRYNIYFILEGILLFMGIIIVIGGFLGKSIYD